MAANWPAAAVFPPDAFHLGSDRRRQPDSMPTSALCLREGASEFRHAADPTFIILSLFPHITKDLRMRQDKEPLLSEAVHNALCDIFGRQHAIDMLRALAAGAQHCCVDGLRAEDGHADPLVAMSDRENFG